MGKNLLTASPRRKRLTVFFASLAITVVVDQLIKLAVVSSMEPGESRNLIGSLVKITYVRNPGAAFGLLSGNSQFIIWAGLIAIMCVLLWAYSLGNKGSVWSFLGLGIMVGGALGNMIDRIFRGRVVDYIDLSFWPVFNLADCAIVVGVIIIIVTLLWGVIGEKEEEGPKGRE